MRYGGKQKYIESPEKMWEYFEQYREWVKNNPFRVHDYVGKDGIEVWRMKERPLTFGGFEVWLFENEIINDLGHYAQNQDGRYDNYLPIIRKIKETVKEHQISGAMTGVFNANLTSRLNGLSDKSEVQTDGKIEVIFSKGKTVL
jgi:hypothetical protein